MQDQPIHVPSTAKKPPYISCLFACVLLLYVTHISQFPLFDFVGLGMLCAFCVLFSLLLATRSIHFAPLPPVVCAVSLLARGIFAEGFSHGILQGLCNLVFAVLAALALFVCAEKKCSKSVTFAVLCVAFSAMLVSHAVFLIIGIYGSFSWEMVGKALEDLSDTIGKMMAAMLEGAGSQTSSGAQALPNADIPASVEKLRQTLILSIRVSLPSFIVCFAMLASVVTLLLYKPMVRVMQLQELCLEGREWRFRFSFISVFVFYLSYIIYFMTSISSPNSLVFVASMNLSTILTYPFAWLGIRFLYTLLCTKTKSRAASVAILSVALPMVGLFFGLGGLLLTVLAFIGASAQLKENARNSIS